MQFFHNHGQFNKNNKIIVKNYILAHNLNLIIIVIHLTLNGQSLTKRKYKEKKRKRKTEKKKNEEIVWLFLSF